MAGDEKVAAVEGMGELLRNPDLTGGAFGTQIVQAKAIAERLGSNVEGLAADQVFRALSTTMALSLKEHSRKPD